MNFTALFASTRRHLSLGWAGGRKGAIRTSEPDLIGALLFKKVKKKGAIMTPKGSPQDNLREPLSTEEQAASQRCSTACRAGYGTHRVGRSSLGLSLSRLLFSFFFPPPCSSPASVLAPEQNPPLRETDLINDA